MIFPDKTRLFFNTIWNGFLGIWAETLAALVFILAGFLVCIFWWGILVK